MTAVNDEDQCEQLQLPLSIIMRGRECLQFSQASSNICYCGADKHHHSVNARKHDHADGIWRIETHTRIKKTGSVNNRCSVEYFSHGTLKFTQARPSLQPPTVIKYATIYPDSDMRCLLQFMIDKWKLESPKLVLNLEGQTEKLSKEDVISIKTAASKTGAWIIKEGHTDLKQGVRWEDNGPSNVPIIGISPLPLDELKRTIYYTHYHPALMDELNSELIPAVDFNYQVVNHVSDIGESRLKPCHTHFLLVANGNTHQQGQDQPDGHRQVYQSILEALSKLVPSKSHVTVPLLNLVTGSSSTLADSINQACVNEYPALCIHPDDSTRQEGERTVGGSGRSEADSAASNMIISYNVLQESDIIQSVLSRVPPVEQFCMAQIWNNYGLAESIIESHSTLDNTEAYSQSMDHALLHRQVRIVELLMKNNFNLTSYLTLAKLTMLYNKLTASPITGILKSVALKKKMDANITLDDVGDAVFELTMGTYKSVFCYLKHKSHSPTPQSTITLEEIDGHTHMTKPYHHAWLDPIHELFILFILFNQSEMAMFFWNHLMEHISGALVGCLILKQLAGMEDDTEHKKTLKELSRTYCHLAEDLINACFCEDKGKTASFLTGANPYPWGTTTCLHLIVMLQEPTLTTQPGVHYVTQDIWTGQIADKDSTPVWKLCLCLFCPLLSCYLITFMDEERSRSYKSMPTRKCLQFIDQDEQVPNPSQTSLDQEASCMNKQRSHCTAAFDDCLKFMESPVIKYCYSMISNVIFLMLYSYIILCNFRMETSPAEIFLIIWVGALYIKEFMEIQSGWSLSCQHRVNVWFSQGWNQVDLLTFAAFTIGMTFKLTTYSIGIARVILAVNLMVLYIRLCIQFFKAHKYAGPLLSMIRHMLTDLFYFLGILCVFLLGYGVATQAILFPNTTDPAELISGVFKRAYFHMFGELFLEEISYDPLQCSNNETEIAEGMMKCPEYSWVGIVLLAIYMMISNVLLLNILIAMFSNTFNQIEEHSSMYWKIQEYDLVMEYIKRPMLPPPFNIFYLPYTIKSLIQVCMGNQEKKFDLKSLQTPRVPTDLNKFEEAVFQRYTEASQQKTSQDITLQDLNTRLLDISHRVDHLLTLASGD